jgi:2-iminobutanoate/2-iminopropanoate deaminase
MKPLFARIYLSDFARDYDGLNRAYYRFFTDDAQVPSRTTVGVAKLGRDALVEIDLVLCRAP